MQLPPDHCVRVVESRHVAVGGWLQVTPTHLLTQVPLSQTGAPPPQLPQAAPAPPHCALLCDASATQLLPLQQPAQFEALQLTDTSTQTPWLHCLPGSQVTVWVA